MVSRSKSPTTRAVPIRLVERDETDHQRRALAVLKQFRLIYGSARRQFRQIEEACGVSGSQLWLMQEIATAPAIGISDLAHRLSIHQTTCSQLVEKLVARGYVIKTRSREDQRRVGLALSAAGQRVLASAPGPAVGVLPEALLALSDTTLHTLAVQLQKVVAELHLPDENAAEKPLADL